MKNLYLIILQISILQFKHIQPNKISVLGKLSLNRILKVKTSSITKSKVTEQPTKSTISNEKKTNPGKNSKSPSSPKASIPDSSQTENPQIESSQIPSKFITSNNKIFYEVSLTTQDPLIFAYKLTIRLPEVTPKNKESLEPYRIYLPVISEDLYRKLSIHEPEIDISFNENLNQAKPLISLKTWTHDQDYSNTAIFTDNNYQNYQELVVSKNQNQSCDNYARDKTFFLEFSNLHNGDIEFTADICMLGCHGPAWWVWAIWWYLMIYAIICQVIGLGYICYTFPKRYFPSMAKEKQMKTQNKPQKYVKANDKNSYTSIMGDTRSDASFSRNVKNPFQMNKRVRNPFASGGSNVELQNKQEL